MNMMKMMKLTVATMILAGSYAAMAKETVDTSKLPPASDKKDVTFAADIKPLFDRSCVGCHGMEKQKAKLRLDSLEAVLKGGHDGKVVMPGDSAKSSLVLSVAHLGNDPDTYMPKAPKGKKAESLTAAQIGLIRAWIDQGAK